MSDLTIHLFRHSKVDSHRGDMPLSADAGVHVDAAARVLLDQVSSDGEVIFLATGTLRTRQTAEGLRQRIEAARPGPRFRAVRPEYAIRNPDLYLAGQRVEMVSTGSAMAAQLPEGTMTGAEVEALPFFGGFFSARDRIEYWLTHPNPPGEDARAVARRIICYCQSLGNAGHGRAIDVVAVSHSPVLRAVLVASMGLADPGEPGWVEPITIRLSSTEAAIEFRGAKRRLVA